MGFPGGTTMTVISTLLTDIFVLVVARALIPLSEVVHAHNATDAVFVDGEDALKSAYSFSTGAFICRFFYLVYVEAYLEELVLLEAHGAEGAPKRPVGIIPLVNSHRNGDAVRPRRAEHVVLLDQREQLELVERANLNVMVCNKKIP